MDRRRCIFLAGKGTEDDEGIAIFARAEGVILKRGDEGVSVAAICRKAGISQATYFNWKKKYAGMLPPEMKKQNSLEDENARLKRIVADLTRITRCYRTSFGESSKACSEAGGGVVKDMCRDWMILIRRACGASKFDRSTYHYTSLRADQAGLERRIREICETRVRYRYRRVHVLLEREGWGTNIKRTYRLLQGLGPAIAEQDAQAPGKGQTSRGSANGCRSE
ncbi:hypothetical protein GCM10007919_28760 [Rhizobium indigoferae]|nr:hypothetical protein GCM10007919_28760 [Rhizobium indigoferae]